MPNKKTKIVVVSGGMDPLHVGHVRMFREARKLGDTLVVILNNDNWLKKKKGFVFMQEKERKEILETIRYVDKVIISGHTHDTSDMSVCAELKKIRPHIFANGGDRTRGNIPEVAVCGELGCKMVFNVGRGGKIQSSSWLTAGIQRTVEVLHHFTCRKCKKWWTIGDAPQDKKEWSCPWCGLSQKM